MEHPHDTTEKIISSAKVLAEDSQALLDDAIGTIVNIALRDSVNRRFPITTILPKDTTHDEAERKHQ